MALWKFIVARCCCPRPFTDPGQPGEPTLYSGTGSLTVGSLTMTATGTFTAAAAPIYSGTGDLTLGSLTMSADGLFNTVDIYTGTGSLTLGSLAMSASGAHTAPVSLKTGTGSLTLGSLTMSAAGTFTPIPIYSGTGSLTLGSLTMSAAGLFNTVDIYTGGGTLTLGALTMSASGTHANPVNPVYSGTGDLTLGSLTMSASGTHAAPTYTGTGSLTLGSLTMSGTGALNTPSYTGTGSVTLGALQMTAAGTFTGGGALLTGTGALTLGSLTMSATGLASGAGCSNCEAATPSTIGVSVAPVGVSDNGCASCSDYAGVHVLLPVAGFPCIWSKDLSGVGCGVITEIRCELGAAGGGNSEIVIQFLRGASVEVQYQNFILGNPFNCMLAQFVNLAGDVGDSQECTWGSRVLYLPQV